MRICIFSTTYFPKTGGAERFMHGLASNLVKMGHIVYVLAPYDRSLEIDKKVNYNMLRIKFIGPFRNIRILLEIVLFLNLLFYYIKYRFDVIQAVLLYPAGYIASLMTRFFKVPSVLRPTGEDIQIYKDINYGLRLNSFVNKRVKLALAECSKAIAISPSILEDLLKADCPGEKIVSISNGLDSERFKKLPVHNIKADLKLKDSDKVVISIGRNHPKKDYKTLVSAISRCPDNMKLVIIGGDEGGLRKFVSPDDRSRIFLLGQFPKNYSINNSRFEFPPDIVIDYLKTSDLFVSTSLIEGSPNVILEAIAAELPIVAVDALGTRDYIKNGKNGLLTKPKDAKALSKAIIEVLSNTNVQKSFSNVNKEYGKEFDWKLIAGKYEALYNTLVD